MVDVVNSPVATQVQATEASLSEEDKGRVFEYFLHEDDVFNERMNAFVALQAMLFAAAAILISKNDPANAARLRIATICIIVIAAIICLAWFYTQLKQMRVFRGLRARVQQLFPELDRIVSSRQHGWLRVSNFTVLTYLPLLFVGMWIVFAYAVI